MCYDYNVAGCYEKKQKVAHFNWYWCCTYPLSLILIISNLKKSYTELIGSGTVRGGWGEKKNEGEIFIKFTPLLKDLEEKKIPFGSVHCEIHRHS